MTVALTALVGLTAGLCAGIGVLSAVLRHLDQQLLEQEIREQVALVSAAIRERRRRRPGAGRGLPVPADGSAVEAAMEYLRRNLGEEELERAVVREAQRLAA